MTASEEVDATATALRYLEECAAGRHAEAGRLLDPNASIVFPGGVVHAGPGEQAAHGRTLYRRIRKDILETGVFPETGGPGTVVVISGTLRGEGLDGSDFAGVRFLDRFLVRGGLVVEHHVWNDLAACGIVPVPRPSVRGYTG